MIFESLAFSLLGSMMGLIGGLLPGINNTVILVMMFFFLAEFDPLLICVFFLSLLTVGQYMGSVTATLLGAPGESTSIPAAKEGFTMHQNGQGSWALAISAWGSLIGSFVAIGLCLLLWPFINEIFLLAYTEVRLFFFLILITVLVFCSQNKIWMNAFFVLLGLAAGSVGLNVDQSATWGTFGNAYLAGGIPKITVIVFLFAIPMILNMWSKDPLTNVNITNASSADTSRTARRLPYSSIVRGSILGFFVGLVPGLSYMVSSKFAWIIEKFLAGRTYQLGDPRCLAAAETANNSAVLSCLIPFTMFIVPITLSEVILLDIIGMTSTSFTSNWLFKDSNFFMLSMAFVLSNVLGFCLAYPLGQSCLRVIAQWNNIIVPMSVVIMIAGVLYTAATLDQVGYYMIVSAGMFTIGWMIRKRDIIPFVFIFLLTSQVSLTWSIFVQKYF